MVSIQTLLEVVSDNIAPKFVLFTLNCLLGQPVSLNERKSQTLTADPMIG